MNIIAFQNLTFKQKLYHTLIKIILVIFVNFCHSDRQIYLFYIYIYLIINKLNTNITNSLLYFFNCTLIFLFNIYTKMLAFAYYWFVEFY